MRLSTEPRDGRHAPPFDAGRWVRSAMDRWLDRKNHPATRAELHYGARIIRCFVERPKSVHEMQPTAIPSPGPPT